MLWFRNLGTATNPGLAPPVVLVQASPPHRGTTPERSMTRAKVTLADWNGDGRPDLIVGDFFSEAVLSAASYHGCVWVYLRQAAFETAGARRN